MEGISPDESFDLRLGFWPGVVDAWLAPRGHGVEGCLWPVVSWCVGMYCTRTTTHMLVPPAALCSTPKDASQRDLC